MAFRARIGSQQKPLSRSSMGVVRADSPMSQYADAATVDAETEASRLDRLDIQDNLAAVAGDLEDVTSRLASIEDTHLHVALNAGAVTVRSSDGLLVSSVGVSVVIQLAERKDIYAAVVQNQESGTRQLYWVDSKTPTTFSIAATTLAGAVVDLSVGTHEFFVIVR